MRLAVFRHGNMAQGVALDNQIHAIRAGRYNDIYRQNNVKMSLSYLFCYIFILQCQKNSSQTAFWRLFAFWSLHGMLLCTEVLNKICTNTQCFSFVKYLIHTGEYKNRLYHVVISYRLFIELPEHMLECDIYPYQDLKLQD